MNKFPMGQIVVTRNVYEWTAANGEFARFVQRSLKRHARGDWGSLSTEDRQENELALMQGNLRLFSAYQHYRLPKIWIITEADRSVTTVLFPDDY
jgi:hypothetical protein